MFSDDYTAPSWTKKTLTGALLIMFFTSAFIGVFFPQLDPQLESSLGSLNDEYIRMTGGQPSQEEIWALTGIYTPIGIGPDGNASSAWGSTRDGWIYGARITNYHPIQYDDLNNGKQAYSVRYDDKTGLYYYTSAGSDLQSINISETLTESTLYTNVTMDKTQRSDKFFTAGGRQEMENGTFLYDFSGYRYCFQPLRDYSASSDLTIDKTATSLSLIWYRYYTDEGISGQIIINSASGGIAYITADDIIRSFNSVSYTSKFDMIFNGLTIHVYLQLNPYAAQHMTIKQCYDSGYWSVLITSPAVTDNTSGFTLDTFSIDNILEHIWNLFTFNTDVYGMNGTSSTIALLFFNMSLYTSLLSLALMNVKTMAIIGILSAVLAAIQAISFFG